MSIQQETFEELCAGYVLGALSTEEALEFERSLLTADEPSLLFYVEMVQTSFHLPLVVDFVEPPPHVKMKILQALLPEPEPELSFWQKCVQALRLDRPAMAWMVACLFLIGTVGLSLFTGSNLAKLEHTNNRIELLSERFQQQKSTVSTLQKKNTQLQTKLTSVQRELKQHRLRIAQQKEVISILHGRYVRMITMSGLGRRYRKGYGKIVWNIRKRRALLQLANLPTVSQKRDYQLWLIPKSRRKRPVSAGVFSTLKADKAYFYNIPKKFIPRSRRNRKRYKLFAITIEKKGGSKRPTMKPILAGRIRL